MIRRLKSTDFNSFQALCLEKNDQDFYFIENRQRVLINNSKMIERVFKKILKHGVKCWVKEEKGEFKAIAIIEPSYKKYLKILFTDAKDIRDLLRVVSWDTNFDIFAKVSDDSLFEKVAKKLGFRIMGKRNNETTMCRKHFKNKKED